MLGVRLEVPVYVCCDNCGVVMNMSIPESLIHKKNNKIHHHSICEAVVEGILRVGKEDGETNLADFLKKVMEGKKCWYLCNHISC